MLAPAEGALGHDLKLEGRFLLDFDPKKKSGGGCLGVDIKAFFWGFGQKPGFWVCHHMGGSFL